MQNHNSHSTYVELVVSVYRDIASAHSVAPSVQRVEIGVIRRRTQIEGLSFLTKTLPRLGKSVDTVLARGGHLSVQGFSKSPNSQLPRFLGWLLGDVFGTDGVELDDSHHSAPISLMHFRQLVYIVYKLKIPYEASETQKVAEAFIETDASLLDFREACESDHIIPRARQFITSVCGSINPRDILPRHGPGAVSTGESTLEKSQMTRIYKCLEPIYPFTEYMCYNLSHVCDELPAIQALEVLEHGTAKVVFVPKDSRGPRLISCEPLEIQWIQQGLGPKLEAAICRHKLTAGFVNFTDQTINQDLALSGSKGSGWVTLDMKDASDRVSNDLVKSLFMDCPDLLAAMQACRSSHTRLPDGRVVELNKFAPMGSRLCFPVEALCFYVLIASALCMERRYTARKVRGRVFIFGDDIIMREEDYLVALQHLPKFGLMFNPTKCCTHGSFRESCGVDAYRGVNITPTRLGTVWCHNRNRPEVLQSYCALRNALFGRGYLAASTYVESLVKSVWGQMPYTDRFTTSLNGAFVSLAGGPAYVDPVTPIATRNMGFRTRFSPVHTRQLFSYVTKPVKVRYDGPNNWFELLRRHSDGFGASGGLYALPRRNRLKRGWMEV